MRSTLRPRRPTSLPELIYGLGFSHLAPFDLAKRPQQALSISWRTKQMSRLKQAGQFVSRDQNSVLTTAPLDDYGFLIICYAIQEGG